MQNSGGKPLSTTADFRGVKNNTESFGLLLWLVAGYILQAPSKPAGTGVYAAHVGAFLSQAFHWHPSSQTMLPPWTTKPVLSSHDGPGFVLKAWGKQSSGQ